MKIRKKLCVSMLLLCMLLCVMSITVAADNTHTHPVCGATHTDIGDHTGSCAAVVWTAWDGTSDIDYGESNTAYVYLSDNATRSSTLTVTGGNTLYLCLGGKTLTGDIAVEGDATLNICDCRGGGEIKTASGNAVCVKTKSKSNVHTTLNLYGGKIGSDSTFSSGAIELYNNDRNNAQTVAVFNMYGGEVYNGGAGEAAVFASYANIGQGYYELNMYGGSIRCEKGNGFTFSNNENVTMQITGGTITSGDYGVNLSSNNKLTLSGNPQFIDKKYYSSSAGIYIPNGVTLTVTDDFAPAGGTTVSVGMFIDDATGTAVIATPVSGKSLSAKAQHFTSAVEGCFVECNADGNLSLTKCAITGQPTKGNRYTVSANGTPNYQWWSTKRGDISVTDERATADTFYYSEWREGWYYSTEASDGTAVTLKAFTLHMAAGDVLKLNNVRDVDGSYFYLTGVSITRSGGSSTPLTGTYDDDYTFTAPADGEYTVEITAKWAVGSSSYYMNFSFTATVSSDVTDAELSGQTDKTLDTTALENGRYICAVTWGNTTLYSDAAEVHNHTWNDGEVTTAPTCTVAGVKTFTCTTCNETKTEPVDALGHDFAGGIWQCDADEHWKKCSRCDVTEPKSAHKWNDGEVTTAPTCTVAGVKTFTCTTCNKTKTEPVDALGHDFAGGAWQSDGTNHWKKCSRCDVTEPKSAHTWNDGEVTTAPTCTVAGEKTFTCTECSATNVQTIDALGHDFTGAWQKDTDNHWKQCSHSGCTATDGKAAHRWAEQTILEATCTADGKKLCICKDCLAANSETLPATGHTLTHHAEKAPTCTEIGWNAYDTCACGYTTYVELPALGHDKIHHNAKAVTCTEKGWSAYETCSRCSYTTFAELPALGHDKIAHEGQAATCINIGWNAYDTCSRCAYTTYVELPALGHTTISHDAKAPTCTEKGWRAYVTCEHCDYTTYAETPALGHDRIHHNAKAVTCTEKGWEAYETCSRCAYTTFAELPALGHDKIAHEGRAATCVNIGWEAYDTCSRCAYTTYAELPALGHTAISHDAKAATCTEKGWRAYVTCEHCDYTTYAETPALGHDKIHHSAKAVTCTEKGWNAYETCSRCSYTTFAELPALGHDKIAHEGQAATCINIGWNAYDTCSRCAYTTYAELPALGHTAISHDAKAPTCTEKGWRAYVTCEHCDYTTYAELPALGHDKIHHNAKAVTCTEKGWEAYETCSRCSYTTFAELSALEHDKIHHDAQAPTCVNIGWEAYDTCSRCAYTTYAELPALGHTTISHDAKAPTCTEKGWRAYVSCEHCDYTTYAETPALGHDKIHHNAKAVTCTENGWNAYETCSRCSYTTFAELPALGHDKIAHEGQAATCVNIGWNAYDTCSRCAYTTYAELPALGHTAISHDAKAPTCTEKGWRAFVTCEHCDYTTYAETPALGHDRIHHNAKAVTCTEKGWEAYETCSRCSYTTFAELPALGHDKIAHEGQAATCINIGWNAYDTCSRCAYTTYAELPALGHTAISHDAKAPTCTEKGWRAYVTCEHCDYTTYAELPALGHDFTGAWQKDDNNHWKQCSRCTATDGKAAHRQNAGDVLAKASCTADGQKLYICEDCFATKSETLPATGHTLTHHEARAATCTEKGWNAYDTCETCGYTTYAETPAFGHDFGDAWKSDAAKHWKECSRCDAVAERASHTGGTATCHDSAVCAVCATSYGERNPDYHTGGSEIRDMTAPTAEKAGHTGNRYCKGCNAKLSDGAGIPALSDLSLDQKSDLTAAAEAMEKILDDWYGDFTEEQKELLTDRIRATGSALASMKKAEEAVKKAQALPAADKTRPDDQSAMDAYDAAKNAYDALSDAEKELAGERTRSALDAMRKALTAYDVIDGNGSTWANTDNEGLTFTVNGYHEKFAGLLINGATVDPKYYVIQAGSTVITLKAEYLQTLSAGKYTVTVRYTDGSTDGEDSFTVTENKTVTPSDPAASSDPDAADGTATHRGVVVGMILVIICVLVLIFLLLFFKKRRKEEK